MYCTSEEAHFGMRDGGGLPAKMASLDKDERSVCMPSRGTLGKDSMFNRQPWRGKEAEGEAQRWGKRKGVKSNKNVNERGLKRSLKKKTRSGRENPQRTSVQESKGKRGRERGQG